MTDSAKKAIKDILIRSVKTFIQCFGGDFVCAFAALSGLTDFDTVKKIFFSALASATSAMFCVIWNSVESIVKVAIPEIDDEAIAKDIEEAFVEMEKDKEQGDEQNDSE